MSLEILPWQRSNLPKHYEYRFLLWKWDGFRKKERPIGNTERYCKVLQFMDDPLNFTLSTHVSFFVVLLYLLLFYFYICCLTSYILFSLNNLFFDSIYKKRWWYNGQHSCLPSSWSEFDSRPSQNILFLNNYKLYKYSNLSA